MGRRYRGAVTRIIAGAAGSLALKVPGAGTRPTSDRVRESLFGALEAAELVRGAAVLDLFAGSGALGLEAASRGAASVDLVERAPAAAAVARRNAARVGRSLQSAVPLRVHAVAAAAFLRTTTTAFDLVLVDPPYDLGEPELTGLLAALVPALTPDAVVVVERAARSPRPELPTDLEHRRDRRYGDTALWWFAHAPQPPAPSQSR